MAHALSILLFLLAGALGVCSSVCFNRYATAIANDMRSVATNLRSGPVDDSGMTAFDRELFWSLLLGNYQSSSPRTIQLGRAARGLFGATVLFVFALVAWVEYSGIVVG